jgi:hypothetical protein
MTEHDHEPEEMNQRDRAQRVHALFIDRHQINSYCPELLGLSCARMSEEAES